MKLMVGGDNVGHGVSGPTYRKSLDDVTNRTMKRPFSLFSDDSPAPRKNRGDADNGDFRLKKQVCLGIENIVREKCNTKTGIHTRDKFVSFPTTKQDFVNIVYDGSLTEDGNIVRDCCTSSVSLLAFSEPLDTTEPHLKESGLTCGNSPDEAFTVSEGLVTVAYANNDTDLGLGKLPSSNCEATECSKPGSQNSKFPVLQKCTALKGLGDTVSGVDLLDSCSCSFCLQAAHIWSDLRFQDIKGQITALEKSQKEASTLVQNISGEMEVLIHDLGSAGRSSKLEFNLLDHWRSLFLHMENVLALESCQLEERCHTLKDLRDNCKMELDMINDELPGNP